MPRSIYFSHRLQVSRLALCGYERNPRRSRLCHNAAIPNRRRPPPVLTYSLPGDDAQTVECQVECARLMSSMAGQAASLLIDGGALGSVEGMLEQLGGKHR